EKPAEVQRGRLPLHVRVRAQDDLLHPFGVEPLEQLLDAELIGADPFDRADRALSDVVAAAVFTGPFHRDDVTGLFDDADRRAVAPRVGADLAASRLRARCGLRD